MNITRESAQVTMADAIAAGDGTLHGAIDYWQNKCAALEADIARYRSVLGHGDEPIEMCDMALQIRDLEAENAVKDRLIADQSKLAFERQEWALHTNEIIVALKRDAERLLWLESLFDRKWNGVVGTDCKYQWALVGNYRHTVQLMVGQVFRDAIDAAIAKEKEA